MSQDPFLIEGPAVISFSGGRTSGYMLKRIVDAGWQPYVWCCFANTGREMPETLDFVHECEVRWNVKVYWLEYRRKYLPKYRSEERKQAAARMREFTGRYAGPLPDDGAEEPGYVVVNYETASRNGEPFDNLIEMMGLPNVTTRMCTQELKIRVLRKFLQSQFFEDKSLDEWKNVIGLRADEPKRIARMRAQNEQEVNHWTNVMPLAEAGITVEDVMKFWREQPFDLQLKHDPELGTYLGNCDSCFLKSTAKRIRVAREHPDLFNWWIEREEVTGQRFREHGKRYLDLVNAPAACQVPPNEMDDLGDCVCHD